MVNKATFEAIHHELSKLNLGEYMKFWKDFNIEWNKVKIAEFFKKIALNSKELFYEDFKASLWKIFEIRDQDEIEKLNKRLKEIRKIQRNRTKVNKTTELNKDINKIKIESDNYNANERDNNQDKDEIDDQK